MASNTGVSYGGPPRVIGDDLRDMTTGRVGRLELAVGKRKKPVVLMFLHFIDGEYGVLGEKWTWRRCRGS